MSETMKRMAYFKVRPTRDGRCWNAYGGLQPLTTDGPVDEPQDPVYFAFAPSEEGVIEKLHQEVETLHGPLRWWRQRWEV